MRHLSATPLASGWRVWPAPFSSVLDGAVPDAPADAMACALPMDVRTLLARHGRCPDPRLGQNSSASDWVITREWWFTTEFTAPTLRPGERVFLRTRGLDDLAELFVNGAHIGSSESFNQVQYTELTCHLRPGQRNTLAIRLWPCRPEDIEHSDRNPSGLDMRATEQSLKACMFRGGDHNAFLVNAGMAMAPELLVAAGALLRFVGIEYEFNPRRTRVSGAVVLAADVWLDTPVEVTLAPSNFHARPATLRGVLVPGAEGQRISFADLPVRPWHPFHLGFPHCYTLRVAAGQQTVTVTTGFRQFERRHNDAFVERPVPSVFDWHPYENNGPYGQEYYKGYDALREAGENWPEKPREGDYRYRHFVNGRELFVMGGSVVPTTLFWADWSGDYLRRLVRRARQSHNNTLRVWGGGYLSGDEFFEEADLQGVMIQQDFLNFAAFHDRSLAFQQRKEREFRNVVRQLNPHPSAVVFNGGNELLQMAANRPLNPIFQCMARVVRQETTNQLFHLSCPVNPEVHGPWFFSLDHAARYNSSKAIFNSECGVMSAPSLKSLQRIFTESELADVLGPAWLHRVKDPGYFGTLVHNVELFGPRREASPADAVRRMQCVQAMGYQYIAEEFRRQKPATSGFTTWEYNEPWIDLNWGLLDNDLIPKAAFWSFRRACAPALLSARFGSYVVAPGAPVRAEVWLSVEGNAGGAVTGQAMAVGADGTVLGRADCAGSADSASVQVGEIAFAAPPNGAFFLCLRGQAADGRELRNDYAFCVLPTGSLSRRGQQTRETAEPDKLPAGLPPRRILFLSGGCYESAVIHEFWRAAGFVLDVRQVSPDAPPADAGLQLESYAAVVLGPVFNPLRSLGSAFVERLTAAVRQGLGFVYFPFNSSAYVSGRYDVDDLRGSRLEELLPVTFAADCYRNSEDPAPSGPLTKACEHPIWNGVSLDAAPALGLTVHVTARPGATVVGTAGGEAALITQRFGQGLVTVFTGPYGGHNYQEVGFRSWECAHRLLANLVEFAATGTVADRAWSPHVFAPLLRLPAASLQATVRETLRSPQRADWEVQVTNPGAVPVFGVEILTESPEEGQSFDWTPEDGFLLLLPGECRTLRVAAVAVAGQSLPETLAPTVTSWNAEPLRPLPLTPPEVPAPAAARVRAQ